MAADPKDSRVVGGNRGIRRKNPEPGEPTSAKLDRALDFYKKFHWGDEAEKTSTRKVSKRPKVLVKLGKLDAVAYSTHKDGERATWEHEFGEEGGKRPDLCMDVDNKRLHIVGGDYDVRPEGIVD